jgi:hypothetical protein
VRQRQSAEEELCSFGFHELCRKYKASDSRDGRWQGNQRGEELNGSCFGKELRSAEMNAVC